MTPARDAGACTAIQLTRAAPLFDRLVDAVLEQRASTVSSMGPPGRGGSRPGEALRERLDWFFPQFRELYLELLRQQLGPDLAGVLSALQDERVQRFLRALETMRPALLLRMQQLGREMTSELESSSVSACSGSTSPV